MTESGDIAQISTCGAGQGFRLLGWDSVEAGLELLHLAGYVSHLPHWKLTLTHSQKPVVAVYPTDFAKHFGRYREEAQCEPVAIASHGRKTSYHISELPDEIANAIEEADMDPVHDHLDKLMDQ